ncbi:hypothetical protein [Rhizobium sp. KDH_Rht_773_N]
MQALIHTAAAPLVGPASLVRLVELRRSAVEALIEELIALLDAIDGDPDLEDNADYEPSLGSTAKCIGSECVEDLEFDDCDDEDGGDEEPTMGWSNPEGLRSHVPDEAAMIHDFDFDFEEGALGFDGSGSRMARALLRTLVAA